MVRTLFRISFILFVVHSFSYSWSDDRDDELERERILRQYGDKKQYEAIISEREEERIKIKIKTYQQRLKDPLIQNINSFNGLNPIERERYLERRRSEQEAMSQFILKHQNLANEIEEDLRNKTQKKEESEDVLEKDLDVTLESLKQQQPPLEEMKESFSLNDIKFNDSVFTKFLNDKNKQAAFKIIKANPFSKMTETEIETMLLQRTDGSKLNKLLSDNHKLRNTIVQIMKDEKAIPSLMSIINKPDELKNYTIACVVVVIIGFFLSLKNSKGGVLKRIFYKVFLSLGTILTNLAIFYLIFEKELTPTIILIKKYYFS